VPKQIAHGTICGHRVAFFDRGDNIKMALDICCERSRLKPWQPKIPEPRRIVVQQPHLALDMLIHRGGRHSAVKLEVHGDKRPKIVPSDRLFKTDEGSFHRGSLFRLSALRAERGAIAFEHDARLEHVLQFAQGKIRNDGTDARASHDHAFQSQAVQCIAYGGEPDFEPRYKFLFVNDGAGLEVGIDDGLKKLLVSVRTLRGSGNVAALYSLGHVNLTYNLFRTDISILLTKRLKQAG
jgi:hypothetical protein